MSARASPTARGASAEASPTAAGSAHWLSASGCASSRSSASAADLADDLLSRLNEALAREPESDVSLSCPERSRSAAKDQSPAGLPSPPRLSATTSARPATAPRQLLSASCTSPRLGRAGTELGAASCEASCPSSRKKRRPHSTVGIQGWGDGGSSAPADSVLDEDALNAAEEDAEKLVTVEVCEASSVPAAQLRCTGECFVELQRQTRHGVFARLNSQQSRVRVVKTSRVRRTWANRDRSERVVRWSGGQCIDVQVSSHDYLIFSLWDYKTIGRNLKIGQARIDCSDILLSVDKETVHMPLYDEAGNDVIGSDGRTTTICVVLSAVPLASQPPVQREWSDDATATCSTIERKAAITSPPQRPDRIPAHLVPRAALSPPATPVLNALMVKLGSHCEHGGEALSFLGLDSDGKVRSRQLAAGMERLGHPKVDLEVLGRELHAVLPGSGKGAFQGSSWSLRADQFAEIFQSRVSKSAIFAGLIPSELEKEKLRCAEDLLEKKEAEMGSLRASIIALKEKVATLGQQLDESVRQEQVSFYAAEDAIKKLSESEAANAKLVRDNAEMIVESTEMKMLKERIAELESRHVGMQEQIDRGNVLNARLIQERKGLEQRLER